MHSINCWQSCVYWSSSPDTLRILSARESAADPSCTSKSTWAPVESRTDRPQSRTPSRTMEGARLSMMWLMLPNKSSCAMPDHLVGRSSRKEPLPVLGSSSSITLRSTRGDWSPAVLMSVISMSLSPTPPLLYGGKLCLNSMVVINMGYR